jgi:hypothetical protein
MRDDLVGYLIGALEAPDSHRVEALLADPQSGESLRRDLELLRRSMSPVNADREPFPAPAGLATRTLEMISARKTSAPYAGAPVSSQPASSQPASLPGRPRTEPADAPFRGSFPADHRSRPHVRGGHGRRHHSPAGGRSSTMTPERSAGHVGSPLAWLDKAILAATALAACILVIPGISLLVDDARKTQTVRKLGRVGGTLQEYAASHRKYPSPPDAGPMSRGGLYAPTLVSEHRIVSDDGMLLSPGSTLAVKGTHRIPTVEEVKAAVGTPEFDEMVGTMGGDFGYTLGHRDPMGRLMPIRPLHRGHHPIMADAPDDSCERSGNHPHGIHHILFEDGRVKTVPEAQIHGDDHLFRNHDGHTAAGKDAEDAVIGDSHHQP